MAFKNLLAFTITGADLVSHLQIGEMVSGVTDGSNKVFTTANSVSGSSLDVYVGSAGGFQLMGGGGVDYTFTGPHTITFNIAPPPGSIVLVDYIH